MKSKNPVDVLRHVRCPQCRKVYLAPRSEAADIGRAVARFDWPSKLCDECLRVAAQHGLQACVDAGEGGAR